MGRGELFSSGREPCEQSDQFLLVIQPISLSNFPTAGAVPPVFPSVAQQSLSCHGPVCKAQLLSPSPPN